jgi:hypothetical protein
MRVNLLTNMPFGKLACSLGLLGFLVQAGAAAPPASEGQGEVAQVEMWHGVRKVDPDNLKKSDAIAHPQNKEKKNPGVLTGLQGFISQDLPLIPMPELSTSYVKDSSPILKAAPWLEETPAPVVIPSILPEKSLGFPKSAVKKGVIEPFGTTNKQSKIGSSGDLSEAQEAPIQPTTGGNLANPTAKAESSVLNSFSNPLLQGAFILGVAVVAPLVSILCFFCLLRRHSVRFGPLFRIDYVGASSMVAGPFTAQVPSSGEAEVVPPSLDRGGNLEELQAEVSEESGITFHEPTPETFELGPTFEEERQLKEDQAKLQEDAVLYHLFEENLRLREQIEQAKDLQDFLEK